jgi:hypothetical protein
VAVTYSRNFLWIISFVWRVSILPEPSPGFPVCHEWLSSIWPSSDSPSTFSFRKSIFWFKVVLSCYSLQFVLFEAGRKMQHKGKQARLFPYFKHLIVHLLIIVCTDIEQIINLFYLFIYLFISFRLYSCKVYLQLGEEPWGTKPKKNIWGINTSIF